MFNTVCCSKVLFNLRQNSCGVETEIRTGEIGRRAAGGRHLEQNITVVTNTTMSKAQGRANVIQQGDETEM